MKTIKPLLTVFLFLVLVLPPCARAREIPGGIVYCDGKDAIFLEFGTDRTMNLTADLQDYRPIKAVAASEDGQVLICSQGDRFWLRKLPDGEPYTGLREVRVGNIRELTLSPRGTHYAFENTTKGIRWRLIEAGKGDPRFKIGKDGKRDYAYDRDGRIASIANYEAFPKYVIDGKREEYNAVYVRSFYGGAYRSYGNSACFPPTMPIRVPYEMTGIRRDRKDVSEAPLLTKTTIPDNYEWMGKEEACKKLGIKRDAHFLAWQKSCSWHWLPERGKQLAALIYETNTGWGPIMIHNQGRAVKNNSGEDAPNFWEIPISLKSCEGLAWRPDEGLTYISEGKLFVLEGRRILEGIGNSRWKKGKMIENINGKDCELSTAAVEGTVLNITGVLVSEGIGDRVHWISNDTFLFRAPFQKGNSLYVWRQGKNERVMDNVPGEFSYLDQPPKALPTKALTPTETEIKQAVAWAEKQFADGTIYKQGQAKPNDYWSGCQTFVARAYSGGIPEACPFHSYDPAAKAIPEAMTSRIASGVEVPPRGSWVYYRVKGDSRGHAALSVGGGFVIHMYTIGKEARVRKNKYDEVSDVATYVGWVWPKRKPTKN